MTCLRLVLVFLGALEFSTAFVPHHRVAWSIRSPASRTGGRLLVTRSSELHVLVNRNTTVYDYSDDGSKDSYEEQAVKELKDIQKLEHLVQQEQEDEIVIHTEQESTTLSTTAMETATPKQEDEGVLSVIWRARLLLLGAAALYGTNFSVVKILGDTMPVGISATLRFGLAALVTLPWLLAPPKDGSSLMPTTPTDSNTNWWETPWKSLQSLTSTTTVGAALAGFEVGMWNAVAYLAQAVGLETTDASKSAFICSLAVCIVPILEVMSGKRLLPRQITGALMAVAGVGFLELGGSTSLALSSGDLASLLQPLMFGVAFWRMEHAMQKYPDEASRSTAGQLLAVFLTSAVYCLSTTPVDLTQILGWLHDPMIVGGLFFTGLITTALTIYMEALALKTLSAAETTLILSTEPLWGAVFASLLIGEQIGMDAAMGAVLIVAGCIFSNLGLDGMMAMVGGKKATPLLEELIMEEDEPLSIEKAEKAIFKVGVIGVLARLVALLEMGNFAIGMSTIVAAEEIAEEVITHIDDLPL